MMRPVLRRAQQAAARQTHTDQTPAHTQQRTVTARSMMAHAAGISAIAPAAAVTAAAAAAASSSSCALLLSRRSFHASSLRRGDDEDQAAKIAAHRERIRLKREADKAAAAAGNTTAPAADADNEPPKPDEVSAPASAPSRKPKKFSDEEPALDELAHRGPLRRLLHWVQDQWNSPVPDAMKWSGFRNEYDEIRGNVRVKAGSPLWFAMQKQPEIKVALKAAMRLRTPEGAFEAKFIDQKRPAPKKTVVKDADWISSALLKSKKEAEMAAAAAKKKEDEAAAAELRVEDPAAYTGSKALMRTARSEEDVWESRVNEINEGLRRSSRVVTRPIKRAVQASETMSNFKEWIKESITKGKDEWENSQDPRVWQMRDMHDKLTEQTETSRAMTAIRDLDPLFNEADFLREMEEFMIPEVITAYRVGDMKLLQSVVDGQAHTQILQHLRARAAEKREWDPRILDIKGVDIVKASIAEDLPYIQLTFVCEHINRDTHSETGEVMEAEQKSGQNRITTGTIATVYYSWALRRDFEHKYYNWKIIDFQAQHLGLLA